MIGWVTGLHHGKVQHREGSRMMGGVTLRWELDDVVVVTLRRESDDVRVMREPDEVGVVMLRRGLYDGEFRMELEGWGCGEVRREVEDRAGLGIMISLYCTHTAMSERSWMMWW